MPWRIRREIYLLVLGVLVMAASIVVFVLNQDASSDVLAGIGFVGGVAIILNTLPTNGEDKK